MNYAFAPGGNIIVPQESPLLSFVDRFHINLSPTELWRRVLKPRLFGPMFMAGFVPAEGELLIGEYFFKNVGTNRSANLLLDLFTDVTVTDSIVLGSLTRPAGTGTGAKTLTDASWNVTANPIVYPEVVFTATGDWTGDPVQGYEIHSQGTSPKIVVIEDDPSGPYTMTDADTYSITPQITIADSQEV